MGIFRYLQSVIPAPKNKQALYQAWMTDAQPIFSSFGNNIYLSDFVNNAIDRVASEISKIEIRSIVQNEESIASQNDDITRLFRSKPNPLQTTGDFLSNVEWLRRKNRNAFIYPQYVEVATSSGATFRKYTAFWPLNPAMVYIGVGDDGQTWEIKMDFADGSSFVIPYADLIHLRWRRGKNTVIGGGDDNGMVNDYDIIRTIDALDKTIQGLPKSIEASLQVKGVYSAKGLADRDRLEKMRTDFESHITMSKSGMIATDLAGDFTPVRITPPEISDTSLNFLKAVLSERYGVSAAILSGDYNGDQHDAFYQTAIEDFIVQFEQAATAGCFTQREQDVGHVVRCYYSRINYMNTQSKSELATLATTTALMTLNQIGEMYGLPPFEGGDRRLQDLNHVSLANVDAYQLAQAGIATTNSTNDNGDGGNE